MKNISDFYPMIFKRLSVRSFDNARVLSVLEVVDLIREYNRDYVGDEIKIDEDDSSFGYDNKYILRVMDTKDTSCSSGDVALLFYADDSDGKSHERVGFEGELLDLYFESKGIGFLWYGMGRVKEKEYKGHKFVIMCTLGYMKENALRGGEEDFKRLSLSEVWKGEFDDSVKRAFRLSPSACNSQPWLVESDNNRLTLKRVKSHSPILFGKTGEYMNTIDIGIALSILVVSLSYAGYRIPTRQDLFSSSADCFEIETAKNQPL